MSQLVPRQAVPSLEVQTVCGGRWKLGAVHFERFGMVVVYRGLHCPICRGYLKELLVLLPEFAARGVSVIAISSDGQEKAETAYRDWALADLTVGYGLSIDTARAWGLYISSSRGKTSLGIEEPDLFAEPGIFIVRPDGTLYASAINTMPFARPNFREILSALDFIVKNDYPARGEA